MAVSTYFNRVKYTAVSAGTVDFVTSAAVSGFRTPATASIPNASVESYVAFSSNQAEWETGQGTYTSGTTTLARATVRESSNAGAKVNFTAAPIVALDFQAQDITNLPPIAINGATIGTNALAVTGTIAGNAVETLTLAPASNTSADGLVLADVTIASSGNQQYSPRIRLTGQGWKTTATAASQAFDWIIENKTVQGTTSAFSSLTASHQVNAGGYIEGFAINRKIVGGGVGTNLSIGSQTAGGSASFSIWTGNPGDIQLDYNGSVVGALSLGGTSFILFAGTSYVNPGATLDTSISRNAAGIIQFGTTAANASGSWLATNGTLSGTLDTTGPIRGSHGYTVATLPAAGTAGRMAYVTDALAPSFLTTVVGGGAVVTPVFDNGTNWVGA